MALIRCTCIYRPSEPADVTGTDVTGTAVTRTGPAVTVAVRDPQCPAAELHERAARARAAVSGPSRVSDPGH